MKSLLKSSSLFTQTLVVVTLVACGGAPQQKPAQTSQELEIQGQNQRAESGVYRLEGGVVAFDLASHTNLAHSLESHFPEQMTDISGYLLIIEPAGLETGLALGKFGAFEAPLRSVDSPSPPKSPDSLGFGSTSSRSLSPEESLSPGLRRSPRVDDLRNLEMVQNVMDSRRSLAKSDSLPEFGPVPTRKLHRSPAALNLSEMTGDLERSYRKAYLGSVPEKVEMSLLQKSK